MLSQPQTGREVESGTSGTGPSPGAAEARLGPDWYCRNYCNTSAPHQLKPPATCGWPRRGGKAKEEVAKEKRRWKDIVLQFWQLSVPLSPARRKPSPPVLFIPRSQTCLPAAAPLFRVTFGSAPFVCPATLQTTLLLLLLLPGCKLTFLPLSPLPSLSLPFFLLPPPTSLRRCTCSSPPRRSLPHLLSRRHLLPPDSPLLLVSLMNGFTAGKVLIFILSV